MDPTHHVFIFLLCSTNLMSELASKFRFLNLNKTQFVDQKLKTLLGGLHLQLTCFRNKDLVTSAAKQVVIYTLVTFQPFPAIGKIVLLLLLGNFRCNFCYLHKFQYFPVLGVTERKEKCFALLWHLRLPCQKRNITSYLSFLLLWLFFTSLAFITTYFLF